MFVKLIGKDESFEVFECARYYCLPIMKKGAHTGWCITLFKSMQDVSDDQLRFNLIWGKDQPYRKVFAMNSKGDTVEKLYVNSH